jgi:HSP20 family protein
MVRYSPGVDLWGEPLAPLRRIQEEINRAFGDQRWAPSAEFPPINIWRSPEGIIVTAEIPGVSLEAVDLTVHQNTLTIKGAASRRRRSRKPASTGASGRSVRSRARSLCRSTSTPSR